MQDAELNPDYLFKLARWRMPFGKHKNCPLIDLPEPYVVWFKNTGFPKGELGKMLEMVYEIKLNGLEYLFEPLRSREPQAGRPRIYRNGEHNRSQGDA